MKHNLFGCLFMFVIYFLLGVTVHTCDRQVAGNREKQIYNDAIKEHSHFAYYDYMKRFPNGKHFEEVKRLDDDLCWKIANSESTIEAYGRYRFYHPDGKYIEQAKKHMEILKLQEERFWKTDKSAWKRAVEKKDYEKYLSLYPFGEYAAEAEKIIVDIEIRRIMSGNYSSLPPMEKISNNTDNSSTISQLSITNNTSHNLTIYYSGTDSKRLKLSPHQTSTLTLRNGNYKIAASVDASNVNNYAGMDFFSGGFYSSNYYIKTIRY